MSKELHTSARNLRLLAATYEQHAEVAIAAGDQIAADGFNDALLGLLDAIDALERADARSGGRWVAPRSHPALPLPAPVLVEFPREIEHA